MTEPPKQEYAATIMSVGDIESSMSFYTDTLEFDAVHVDRDGGFAVVRHDGVAIHLLQTDRETALKTTAENVPIYVMMSGVDTLYASLESKLAARPTGRVRPPFAQDYSTRKFHVKDPDGCLLFFAEDT